MTIGRCPDPARLAAATAAATRRNLRADGLATALSVYRISNDGHRCRTLDVPLLAPPEHAPGRT